MAPLPLSKKINPLKLTAISAYPTDWSQWKRVKDGYDVRSGNGGSVVISDSQLNEADPFAPEALQRLLDPTLQDAPPAPHIEYHIRLWKSPIVVETLVGSMVAIRGVRTFYPEDESLTLMCEGGNYIECTIPGTDIAICKPVGSITAYMSISNAYLDDNYPGWKKRFEVANGLDLEPTLTLLHMMDKTLGAQQLELPSDIFCP